MSRIISFLTVIFVSILGFSQSICMVTADEPTGEDYIVIWNEIQVNEDVDSVFIYRKQGTQLYFHKMGAVAYEEGGTNQFVDSEANTQDTTKYAIAYLYNDGTLSQKSLWHQAVVLDYDGLGSFSWTPYTIEEQESADYIESYELMKDNTGSGNFLGLGSLLNSLLSVLDLGYLLTPNAEYRIHTELPSCEALEKANIHTSRSNIKQQISNPTNPSVSNPNADAEYEENLENETNNPVENLSIGLINSDNLKLYPNPATNEITVEFVSSSKGTYSVIDMTGRAIVTSDYTGKVLKVDVSDFKVGTYFIKIDQLNPIPFVKK